MIKKCEVCGDVGEHRRVSKCKRCEAKQASLWRKANPEKAREHVRQQAVRRKTTDPGYDARRKRIKRKNNPEHYREQYQQRLEWLRRGSVTKQQLESLVNTSGGLCFYCREPVKCRLAPYDPRGFDHVVPRVRGGEHRIENMVVCCGRCNALKSGA